jgi:hypothetical protein
LRLPGDAQCPNGHLSAPPLTIDDVLSRTQRTGFTAKGTAPICGNCGIPMVKIFLGMRQLPLALAALALTPVLSAQHAPNPGGSASAGRDGGID